MHNLMDFKAKKKTNQYEKKLEKLAAAQLLLHFGESPSCSNTIHPASESIKTGSHEEPHSSANKLPPLDVEAQEMTTGWQVPPKKHTTPLASPSHEMDYTASENPFAPLGVKITLKNRKNTSNINNQLQQPTINDDAPDTEGNHIDKSAITR